MIVIDVVGEDVKIAGVMVTTVSVAIDVVSGVVETGLVTNVTISGVNVVSTVVVVTVSLGHVVSIKGVIVAIGVNVSVINASGGVEAGVVIIPISFPVIVVFVVILVSKNCVVICGCCVAKTCVIDCVVVNGATIEIVVVIFVVGLDRVIGVGVLAISIISMVVVVVLF